MYEFLYRYERYEKNRQAVTQGSETLQKNSAPPIKPNSLVDLSDHYQPSASAAAAALPTITTQLQGLGNLLYKRISLLSGVKQLNFTGLRNQDESEFDMFAQSRNVTYESSKPRYESDLK